MTKQNPLRVVAAVALSSTAALMSGCMADVPDEPFDQIQSAAAVPGPWAPPESTLAIGRTQNVPYTVAADWDNGAHCVSSFPPGTQIVINFLRNHFVGISSFVSSFECKPGANPDRTSFHATGRAIDVMIPMDGSDADNGIGDPVGNFLIENAKRIGVQYIIWDRMNWKGRKGDFEEYTGTPHPHTNHLHVELTPEAAFKTEPWFEDLEVNGGLQGCKVAEKGATVDDNASCVQYFGNSSYWRVKTGVGHGNSLHWTQTSDRTTAYNSAMWALEFDKAGEYLIEVHLVAEYAQAPKTRYTVKHDGKEDTITLDQSAAAGWVKLGKTGKFKFAAGGKQNVAIYDNIPGQTVKKNICVDAIRLTRTDLPPPDPGTGGSGGGSGTGGSSGDPGAGGAGTGGAGTGGAAPETGGSAGQPPDTEVGGSAGTDGAGASTSTTDGGTSRPKVDGSPDDEDMDYDDDWDEDAFDDSSACSVKQGPSPANRSVSLFIMGLIGLAATVIRRKRA